MPKVALHAHKLVMETAVSMGHELYDCMMQDNVWWSQWQDQNPGASRQAMEKRFIRKNIDRLIPQARATLAHILSPGHAQGLSEDQKNAILEALVLDNQLVAGRKERFVEMN